MWIGVLRTRKRVSGWIRLEEGRSELFVKSGLRWERWRGDKVLLRVGSGRFREGG